MRKLTFLFALLCVSVMGFAIDWSGYEYLGDGAGGGAYSNKYKLAPGEGQGVVNIQHPGWATADGIYTTFPAGVTECSLGAGNFDSYGAGMILHLSAFTAKETEVTVTHGTGTCVFTVYYEDGTEGDTGGGDEPVDPTPDPEPDPNSYTAGGHTITLDASYVNDIYTLVISSTDNMEGLGGSFWFVNGVAKDMRTNEGTTSYTVSDDKKTITCVTQSTSAPSFDGNLYVLFPGEANFGKPTLNWEDRTGTGGGSTPDPTPEPTAEGEKFIAANASINSVYIAPGWTEDTESEATVVYNSTTGVITATILKALSGQWQGQVKMNLGFSYVAGKYYDFSIKFHADKAVNQVTLKTNNNNVLFYEDQSVTIPADEDYVWTKSDVSGIAGDNIFVFDFGHASANTTVTISNISIIEHDAPAPSGDGIDWSSLSWITNASGNNDYTNKYKAVAGETGPSNIDVIQSPGWASGNIGLYVTFPSADFHSITANGSALNASQYTINGAGILFHMTAFTAIETEIVVDVAGTERTFTVYFADGVLISEYCGYEGDNTQQDGHYVKLTWETADNGDVIITLASGTNSGVCSYRNGGFEGGISTFEISTDNFATSTPASDYFTSVDVNSGNTYTLTKKADLPIGAKIKHSTGALAWVDGGVNRYCFPEYIYTYGSVCAEEPELTSITLSASANIAQVGGNITLTSAALDQYGSAMDETITYSVNPADAGTFAGNVFTFEKVGAATITATSGAVSNSIVVYGVSSDNIALNKTSEAGYNPGNQAEINTKVNDGAENTAWVTWDWRDASEEWWYVDLGSLYDITGISVLWGADYSTNYILQVRDDAPSAEEKANDGAWTTVATVTTASANNVAFNYVTATGRYVRLHSLAKPGPCIRLRELQVFGSESATLTKAVSASVNDDAMGTATVKQSGEAVTEVDTNSEVEFSAVAKDGYIFVSWSNGETRPTFTTTVSETMNLTATFRAMGTVYCNTLVHSSNGGQEHDAYVTMKRTAANTYQLIVRAEYELGNFSNTEFRIKEEGAANTSNFNLNNKGVLSDGNHTLTGTIISTVEPEMISGKLYVNIVGQWEGQFDRLTNIEYAVACDDNVSVTSIELSQSSAKLLVSKTLTLTPMFAPVYATDKALTWETSNSSVATVVDGVVTAQAAGTATITAKLTSDNSIYATCTVTVVESLTEATWYGYEFVAPQEGQTVFTYAITRSVDQKLTFTMTTDKNVIGFVAFININGTDYQLNGYGAGLTASYTTTDTYEDNVLLNCMWDFRSANYRQTFDFTYRVGDENDALKILTIDDDVDNTTIIEPFDGQNVNLSIVNRSFVADNLYTLVLPFDADAAQTAAKLPGKLTKLSNTYVKENKDLRVNFVDAEAIEAGVPYLYTPSADVKNAIFENVTVSKDLHATVPADGLAAYYGIYAPTTGSALKNISNAYVLGSDQYLYDVQTLSNEQSMKALRGYFVLNFPANTPSGMRARVVFNSQETEVATGISDVQSDVQCTKVIRDGQLLILRDGKTYNVQGQLIK